MAIESEWYMTPVREEGKSQGLPGCLAYSLMSRSAASWGMEICRMEFSVLGRDTMRWLRSSFVACLLTKMVRLPTSKSSPQGNQFAFPNPTDQPQIEHSQGAVKHGVDASYRGAAEPRLFSSSAFPKVARSPGLPASAAALDLVG